MTTAAIYLRLSDDDTGAGIGVANQLADCKAFIESKGWSLGEIYQDNSISATTGKVRPEFERMLRDAPGVVVYYRQNRLERGHDNALDRFLLAGCEGYGTDGTRATMENASSELITRLFSILGRFEGQQKAERQKLAYKGEHERGLPRLSRPVFGNNLDGTLMEEEAEAIRTGAKDFLNKDASLNELARRWNAAGLRTPFSQSEKNKLNGGKGRGGNLWDHRRIAELFGNERLIGKRTYNGLTVTLKDWTPVLTEEVFEGLQIVLSERKTGVRGKKSLPSGSHLLSSILRCAECDGLMVTGYAGGKNNERLYKCQTIGHFSKNAEKTDAVVVNDFLLTLVSPEAQKTLLGDSGNLSALTVKRAQMIIKHREWIEEALEEDVSPKVVAQKEAKHEEALKAINAEILELDKDSLFEGLRWDVAGKSIGQMHADLVALEAEAWERWERVPMERKRRIVQVFYDRISAQRGARGYRFKPESIVLEPSELLRKLQANPA